MYPGLPTRMEKEIRQLYLDRVLKVRWAYRARPGHLFNAVLTALWISCPIKAVACPMHGCSALWISCPIKAVACPIHGCSALWISCPIKAV